MSKDVLDATKGVDVDARKEALQIAVRHSDRFYSSRVSLLGVFYLPLILDYLAGTKWRDGSRKQGTGRQAWHAQGSALRSSYIDQGQPSLTIDFFVCNESDIQPARGLSTEPFVVFSKTFETEFDARLDACLQVKLRSVWFNIYRQYLSVPTTVCRQSILSYKIGTESDGDASGAHQS
jgi:hypothetical protein